MLVEVKMVDRLACHYGWILGDGKEAKKLVEGWGFTMEEELELVREVRGLVCRLKKQGTEVL